MKCCFSLIYSLFFFLILLSGCDPKSQHKINAHHHRSNRNIPLHEPYKPITYWLRQAGYTCILGNNAVKGKGRKTEEELYDLKNDPYELNNLAGNPDYAKQLTHMRLILKDFEKEMTPVSNEREIVEPVAVAWLDWIMKTKPALYQQMLAGKEIGFHKLTSEYNKEVHN